MIGEIDWKNSMYGRLLPPSGKTTCPMCDKTIHEGVQGITYSKTKGGRHLFIHIGCVKKGWMMPMKELQNG